MQCGIGFGKEKGVVSEVGNAGSFRAGRCVEQDLGNRGEWMYGQSAGLRIRVITGQNQVSFSGGQQICQFALRVTGKFQPDRCFQGGSCRLDLITKIRWIHILRIRNPDGRFSVFFLIFQLVFQEIELKTALLKVGIISLSCLSQRERTAGAREEAAAKLCLQLADLLADGGLADRA